MSKSTLIDAFLKLQATEHSNIFEAAKKAKKDWDGDGKVESGKDEYLGSKIAAAKKAGKIKAYRADRDKHGEMEEEVEAVDEASNAANKIKKGEYETKVGTSAIADKDNEHGAWGRETIRRGLNPDVAKRHQGRLIAKGRSTNNMHQKGSDVVRKEETDPGFSEAELAHFEAVIARKDQKGKEKGIGDTVPSEDLTDEYINEMAARGVKAGTKRGSYKKKATDLQGNRAASADAAPDEGSKGVPHVLDQIRHGHEDEHGFKSITHPASSPEAPVTKKIHRSELHGFYDRYHNTEKPAAKEKEYSSFLGKHFGDSRSSSPTTKSVTTDLSKVEKANLKGGGAKPTLGGSKLVGGNK